MYKLDYLSYFPLSLIHTDISDPINRCTLQGGKYLVVALYDHTNMSAVFFSKQKSQFDDSLLIYHALVQKKQFLRFYRIGLDQTGGHTRSAIGLLTPTNGIVLENSPSHAKESNGVAYRLIIELWKTASTLLLDSRLRHYLWLVEIAHSSWLRIRIPSSDLDFHIP